MSSRLDGLLKLFLSLVRDELALALLLSFSTLDKPDNPSLLCIIGDEKVGNWKNFRNQFFD